jgi:hypothetical protein
MDQGRLEPAHSRDVLRARAPAEQPVASKRQPGRELDGLLATVVGRPGTKHQHHLMAARDEIARERQELLLVGRMEIRAADEHDPQPHRVAHRLGPASAVR